LRKVYRQTDGQTDGRRTPRDCISSFQWNELKNAQNDRLYAAPAATKKKDVGAKRFSNFTQNLQERHMTLPATT